jgi:uncharacterized protein (DUF1810 family)
MKTEDPYHLQRFVAAQAVGGTCDHAAELRAGRKTSHWMWFIFPQIAGLGYSPASRMYAITSLEEARAYMAHPVLGARLIECATILTGLAGRTAEQIPRRSRRAEAPLVDHAVHARRSPRAGVRSGPGPVFRRRTRLRDRESHLNTTPADNVVSNVTGPKWISPPLAAAIRTSSSAYRASAPACPTGPGRRSALR